MNSNNLSKLGEVSFPDIYPPKTKTAISNPSSKLLVFYAKLGNKSRGKLLALDKKTSSLDGTFQALSGIHPDQRRKGMGPIPSQEILNIPHYRVHTKALFLPKKGIEGNFYGITPFQISLSPSSRGDFGIHADRNVPGTAGCIGIKDGVHWENFKRLMDDYAKAGITSIPLIVSYHP